MGYEPWRVRYQWNAIIVWCARKSNDSFTFTLCTFPTRVGCDLFFLGLMGIIWLYRVVCLAFYKCIVWGWFWVHFWCLWLQSNTKVFHSRDHHIISQESLWGHIKFLASLWAKLEGVFHTYPLSPSVHYLCSQSLRLLFMKFFFFYQIRTKLCKTKGKCIILGYAENN